MEASDRPNKRILDRLAIVVGLFGERGWPEMRVMDTDDQIKTLPLPDELAAKVQYARKFLLEFDRKPITTTLQPSFER